jgi:hypothetical protein
MGRSKKLSDFRQQAMNANKHTERGMKALEASMNEVGYTAPMIAAADGEIIAGNAGIVDQNADRSEFLLDRGNGSLHLARVAHLEDETSPPDACRRKIGRNPFRAVFTGRGTDDCRALAAQFERDGTADAARRLERVLTNDPATGVMRHADAGYDIAIDCAREKGLNLPMID